MKNSPAQPKFRVEFLQYLLPLIIREYRWAALAMMEAKEEWAESDLLPKEMFPKSASFSGWMRNGREVSEFATKNRGFYL
jgi:hypothetical protein